MDGYSEGLLEVRGFDGRQARRMVYDRIVRRGLVMGKGWGNAQEMNHSL